MVLREEILPIWNIVQNISSSGIWRGVKNPIMAVVSYDDRLANRQTTTISSLWF